MQGALGPGGDPSVLRAHSFEELYSAVTDLCLQKHAAAAYDRLRTACRAHVVACVESLRGQPEDPSLFLPAVQRLWHAHCAQLSLLRAVFLYLDRTFAMGGGNGARAGEGSPGYRVLPIWDAGLQLLGEALGSRADVLSRIVRGVVAAVGRERAGEAFDRGTLGAVCAMLTRLGVSAASLEPPLVAAARAHYAAEGAAEMARGDVSAYLLRCEARLREERDRVAAYLHPDTLRPLLACVEEGMLAAHAPALIERGFQALVEGRRVDDLRRMFVLLLRVGRTDELRAAFAALVKRRALAIVGSGPEELEGDKAMVGALIEMRDEMDALVAAAFRRADAFAAAVRAGIEVAVNSRENRPAELIARFVDARMRASKTAPVLTAAAGGGGFPSGAVSLPLVPVGEMDLDTLLDKVLALFRCLHGKDVFEAFYKKDLAKRLLYGRFASLDAEKGMVARLKTECGAAFTAKLEGMFADVQGSQQLQLDFVEWVAAGRAEASPRAAEGGGAAAPGSAAASSGALLFRSSSGDAGSHRLPVETVVHVLSVGYWPSYPPSSVVLPSELAGCAAAFERFYATKHSGRKLAWQSGLGHAIVRASFPSGRKELDVSLHQALVLLLFNTADSLTFTAIAEATRVEDAELRRTLQSMALGQVRVLRKEPKGREVLDSDTFFFNAGFAHALIRIKIPTIQAKETRAEAEATREEALADRQYQMDAAIVRIMKSRKSLPHQELVAETMRQLRFPSKAADIKKRIENLIERDYLERDESAPNVFNYVA